jgi:hypothetical protein
MRERLFDAPFYVAYSGGKDSSEFSLRENALRAPLFAGFFDVIRILFELADAPHEL